MQTLSTKQRDSHQGGFYAIRAAVPYGFDSMTSQYTANTIFEKNAPDSMLATPIICGRRSADFWPSF